MGKAMFYHLTRRPMEETLMMLLGKAAGAGWRVVVRGTDADRMAALDEKLWQGSDDSFMPHGLAGGPHDARQPVLLSTGTDLPNAAACVMAVDGAHVTPDEVTQLDRVCVLFDGNDPQSLDVARGQWSALKTADVAAEYWSEESGSWQKKAQTAAD